MEPVTQKFFKWLVAHEVSRDIFGNPPTDMTVCVNGRRGCCPPLHGTHLMVDCLLLHLQRVLLGQICHPGTYRHGAPYTGCNLCARGPISLDPGQSSTCPACVAASCNDCPAGSCSSITVPLTHHPHDIDSDELFSFTCLFSSSVCLPFALIYVST